MTNITEFVRVLRSKNAGPYRITLDLIFKDEETYNKIKKSGAITKELIAKLYRIPIKDIYEFVWYRQGCALKSTIKRPIPSGSMGEADVYAAQQHAPLYNIEIPEEKGI